MEKNNSIFKAFGKNLLWVIAIITIIPITIFLIKEFIKYRKISNKEENQIKVDTKLGFKENDLWDVFGGKKNITSVTATINKVNFALKNPSLVNIEKLKKFPKVSGVMEGNNKVSVIFGSISKTIEQKFNN